MNPIKIVDAPLKVVQDKKHEGMYRLQWPDGTISVNTPHPDRKDGHYGFYNKTWASEHKRLLEGKTMTLGLTYNASQ